MPVSMVPKPVTTAGTHASALERVSVWWLGWFVFIIAACIRVGALIITPEYVTDLKQQVEVRNVALNLAHTGEFANPYFVPTGKTAHLAPLAPFLTSLV